MNFMVSVELDRPIAERARKITFISIRKRFGHQQQFSVLKRKKKCIEQVPIAKCKTN